MIAAAVMVISAGAISEVHDALGGPDGPSQALSPLTIGFDLIGLGGILIALLTLPAGRAAAAAGLTFGLDASTVLAGSALFAWYFVARTAPGVVATTGSQGPLVGTVAAALLGVLALLKISFADRPAVDPKALQLLALAALSSSCTAAMGPLLAGRPHLNASLLAYPAAYGFLTAAAERQRLSVLSAPATEDGPAPSVHRLRWLQLLPYVAVALVDGLLLHTMSDRAHYRQVAIGAVVLTALVVGRQVVSLRENSRLLGRLDTTVRELRASENRLTYQAKHDALTGLANRVVLKAQMEAALNDSASAAGIVMALIDLDDFKLVNDRLGHVAGDRLLIALAGRLEAAFGPEDLVARLGGDEFAVLLDGAAEDPSIATRRIEAALRALSAPLSVDGDELKIRASAGLAGGWAGAAATELIRRADVAMYAAKARGGGGCAWFSRTLDAPAADQSRLARALRTGLGRGDFRLVYQPIVTLPDGRIAGVEALIRWHDPERGIIPPERFIPVAERSGLIVPLGRWVLREACRQAADWRRELGERAPGRISVNVSPRQLDEKDFVDEVTSALADAQLPASCLVVEVTETAVFHGGAEAVAALNALRAVGIRVALDDFGTGQSSLGLLLTCPVDILKVDKSFVEGVTEPGQRSVIVEFLSEVAGGLHLDTVVEGIEEAAQAVRLHQLGYRMGQGFLFSRPLPADELGAVLTGPAPTSGHPRGHATPAAAG